MVDPDNEKGPDRYFGWDNEKPERHLAVNAFEAKARPITNEDFARFLDQTHNDNFPAAWTTHKDTSAPPCADNAAMANGNGVYMNGLSPPLTKRVFSTENTLERSLELYLSDTV